MQEGCEYCSDRDLIASRAEGYRHRCIEQKQAIEDLNQKVRELDEKLKRRQEQRQNKDALLLAQAQLRVSKEKAAQFDTVNAQLKAYKARVQELEKQHEKDVKDKEAIRTINIRFLEEVKASKFNLCIMQDQLKSAHKFIDSLQQELNMASNMIDCHAVAQRIMTAKIEAYEQQYLHK